MVMTIKQAAKPHAARRGTWRLTLAVCLVAAAFFAPAVRGADKGSLEDQVKSAFILNFVQFVDWPDKTFAKGDDPIVIGVVGSDAVEAALTAATEGKTIKGRKIVIKHFPAESVGPCQVLFIAAASAQQAPGILKAVGDSSTLTVGDSDNFTEISGTIRFYLEDRKVRFEINQAAAERAHLQVSAKLLKLARVINK
jgi:hypothetical protein